MSESKLKQQAEEFLALAQRVAADAGEERKLWPERLRRIEAWKAQTDALMTKIQENLKRASSL